VVCPGFTIHVPRTRRDQNYKTRIIQNSRSLVENKPEKWKRIKANLRSERNLDKNGEYNLMCL
jgi:hypothetical protein